MYLARGDTTSSGENSKRFSDGSENDVSNSGSTEPGVESNRRTFLKAAGGGGATFALATGGGLTGEAEAQEARTQNSGFKAYSGVLRVRRSFGAGKKWKAEIEFDNFPAEGDILGPRGAVRALQAEQAGGRGEFNVTPANLVTFRSPRIEDQARGNQETDWWNMDSRVSRRRLEIWWETHETNENNSKFREIVFMVMGM